VSAPLVSVLVPVYNVEDYLERCLDSILRQTLSELEIICVNDGSTDSSLSILEKYKAQDDRVKIVNKKNGGLPSARNAGIDAAQGKYVSFIDSDDFIELNMMERLYKTAEEDKAEIVICGAEILPREPTPHPWILNALSPGRKIYDSCDPTILFKDNTIVPFLWRVFVKRELIDKHHLRLNEKVQLGEDMAFQAKLYFLATSISVIPDKLYHYVWYRENSLMQELNYKNPETKVIKHIDLIEDILNTVESVQGGKELNIFYLKWAIDFIYKDFIYLSYTNKATYADRILSCLEKAKYYKFKFDLPLYIREEFFYINKFRHEKGIKPIVSIVCVMEGEIEYFDDMFSSLQAQTISNFELILVNNHISDSKYIKIKNLKEADSRVRLINIPRERYYKALNVGVALASAPYIAFVETYDWYKNKFSLEKMITKMNEGFDICATQYTSIRSSNEYLDCIKISGMNINIFEKALLNDFQNVLYRAEFLRKNSIRFNDSSIWTGFEFLVNACCKTESLGWLDEVVYIHREIFKPDWISTDKCVKIMRSANRLLDIANSKEFVFLQYLLVDIINGDKMKTLLGNNTLPWKGDPKDWPNGENSQVEFILQLMEFCMKISPEVVKKYSSSINYLDTFCTVIERRHEVLAKEE
jgi:glycosyltransferase involved in cell wall biosynthesis